MKLRNSSDVEGRTEGNGREGKEGNRTRIKSNVGELTNGKGSEEMEGK